MPRAKNESNEKGHYNTKLKDPTLADFADFSNPWNFYALMQSSDSVVHAWMRHRGLLLTTYMCPRDNCHRKCTVYRRKTKKDGFTLRCEGTNCSEFGIRKNSIFEKSHFSFQDLMHFLKCFLEDQLLISMSKQTGMDYKSTSVQWAKTVRDIFKQYIYENVHGLNDMIFSEICELDESIFGRRVKYNKGNPNIGVKVSNFETSLVIPALIINKY